MRIVPIYIFDFDGTLVETDSKVYVVQRDGTQLELNADEFNKYVEQPGDKFDYREFFDLDHLLNPRDLDLMTKFVKLTKYPHIDVAILTARKNTKGIETYMRHKGVDLGRLKIVGMGTSDPRAKRDWIEELIKNGYTELYYYEDSQKNVDSVRILKRRYPKISLKIIKVDND